MKTIIDFLNKNTWRILISTFFSVAMAIIAFSPDVVNNIETYSQMETVLYALFSFCFPFLIQWFIIPLVMEA